MALLSFTSRAKGSSHRKAGDSARDSQDWAAAARSYSSYLEHAPQDFAIWVQLGHARKEAGDLEGAKHAYGQALLLEPLDPDLLLNFGRLHALLGNRPMAIELLSKSFQLDGNRDAEGELKALLGHGGKFSHLHRDGVSGQLEQDIVANSGFFNTHWYTQTYQDVDAQGALRHFCTIGAFEGRSPGPEFDAEWYMLQNPDLIPGVTNRVLNPLLHFIEHGHREGRSPKPHPGTSEAIKDLVDGVFDLDPEIYAVERFASANRLKSLRVTQGIPQTRALQAFKRLFASLTKPYDYVIAVPWLKHGGADLVAIHLARAISELTCDRSVLIVACDFPDAEAADWLPGGADLIMIQDNDATLPVGERVEVLSYLLQAIRPQVVINVNSETCWELFKRQGRPLSHLMRLYGCAFCRDYSPDDRASGYADTHLRETLTWLSGMISDNTSFCEVLADHFTLPAMLRSRFITLYNPAPSQLAAVADRRSPRAKGSSESTGTRDFTVLWASRLARQKNVDLLKRIVAAAPDICFEIWGRGEDEPKVRELAAQYENAVFRGSYGGFDRLPLRDYDAFLYTALWDGIPNVLLEAASTGFPVVASRVGGIHELIDDQTGWLVDDVNDAAPYVAALREIRADPAKRDRRLAGMDKRLAERHGWTSFKKALVDSGIVKEAADAQVA